MQISYTESANEEGFLIDPMERVIELARHNVAAGGRPFACVIVRGGELIAEGPNLVAQTHDPTAHAEVVAIRAACRRLGSEHLHGCEVYVLAYPCPMCLAALYYCSPDRVVYAVAREDYAAHYRDDRRYFEFESFYGEFAKPAAERRLPTLRATGAGALEIYREWGRQNQAC